ncbi:MAG: hypothetical protein H8E21_18145 [Gammaproteobacteria bacterium]|nr:hypothetical protein [Gammaproteobacteria bacterium]
MDVNETETIRQKVTLLQQQGEIETAAELLSRSGQLQELEGLILQQAGELMAQGSFTLLQSLIRHIPDAQRSPWIHYWSASALLAQDPLGARQLYQRSMTGFEGIHEIAGQYLSWSGIIDSFIFAWDDFKPLDQWIVWIEDFQRKNPAYPSAEIEVRITFSMFCALMYRMPQHRDMKQWADKLGALLDFISDHSQRIAMATHYVLYLSWMGEFEQASGVVERLKPYATLQQVQPVYLIAWQQSVAMQAWLTTRFEQSQKAVTQGLMLAEQSGIHLWDFILRVQQAYLAFEYSPPQKWSEYLQQVLAIMDQNGRLHQAHYYYMAALEALLQKRLDRALAHNDKSLKAVEQLATPFPEALNLIARGRILIEMGELDLALQSLTRAEAWCRQIKSAFLNFNLQLTQAELAFASGQTAQGLKFLALALKLGHQKNYFNSDWWRPDAMCALCLRALQNDIETDYVQALILRRKLKPAQPPFELENWPWKVRINSLGIFSITLNNSPFKLNAHKNSKPIEMLKVLIAQGGVDVSEDQLCAILWPDAEGDKAHSVFTTTLSRLRQQLGADVLLFANGQLSLNDNRCWLDIWALERALKELDGLLAGALEQNLALIERKTRAIFELYQGSFLEKESQTGWMLAQSDRLKNKLSRAIRGLIHFYGQQRGECQKVISLYQRAKELEPYSEEYCRGLMSCHAAQGNRVEALAIFERCAQLFSEGFGISPSEKTTRLYQHIKSARQEQLNRFCEHCVPIVN